MVEPKWAIPTTQVCNEGSLVVVTQPWVTSGEVIFLRELTSFFIVRGV
jgi:hypothetical protein